MRSVVQELRGEQESGNEALADAMQRMLDERLAERLATLAEGARA